MKRFVPRAAAWHDEHQVTADIAFDLALEHGRCVGIRIPAADAALDALAEFALPPEERARAAGMPGPRRRSWVGGRAAMREALARLGLPPVAVPTDDRGAPVLPGGIAGSLTHKEGIAAALVARESKARVGVDLELDVVRSLDIAARVLTPGELSEIAHLDDNDRAREVLLRFSAKEAVYKALDPFVRRYVAFGEVAVSPCEDGTARVAQGLRAQEGPFAIDVRWRRFDGIVLTTARVTAGGT
jgi:enterobactin synthetase component D